MVYLQDLRSWAFFLLNNQVILSDIQLQVPQTYKTRSGKGKRITLNYEAVDQTLLFTENPWNEKNSDIQLAAHHCYYRSGT